MSRKTRILGWMTAAAIVGCGLLAADERREVASVSVGAVGVEWLPAGSFDRYVLTVTGPGGLALRQEFAAGKTPAFGLFDENGQRLPDGLYTYELQAIPRVPRAIQKQMADAHAADDTAALEGLAKSGKLPQGAVQSGHFTIHGGAFVPAGLVEPQPVRPAKKASASSTSGLGHVSAADNVIADDLIVQGSACVGLDCVNNESFGFDTIRLKENNTRIVFMDTSTGTGFPTHDWQLTANDSASGGAEKFSIEDLTAATVPFTLSGSAPSNALFVDSVGRVGLGTATPVLRLHESIGDTPAIRLEQTGTSGFTPQTWDVAGNEANFFVRDVTSGSRLPLRIRPGAPTSSLDINAAGNIGFGTASPENKLDARGDVATRLMLTTSSDTQASQVLIRRSRGLSAAPTALASQDNFGSIGFRGYDGSAFTGDRALISVATEEAWSGTGNGARMIFATTPPGTTAIAAQMVIKGDGKVGIGNLSPTQALDVTGNIRASGSFISNATTLNVPDYVFEPGYKLASFPELRAFLAKEKHLPNVPSAAQLKESGVDLGAFQMRLLEKVEELTLYTVSQEDHIDALRKENAQLQERLLAIERALQTAAMKQP